MHSVEAFEEKEQREDEREGTAEKRLARYREWAIALTLTLGAFLVRAVYVFLFTDYPHYLFADMGGYWARALTRLHGETSYPQWSLWPPAYHLLLTQLFRFLTVLGVPQSRWLAIVLVLQMIPSSLSVYGVFRLARTILPTTGLSFNARTFARTPLAFTVAVLYGLSYPLIYFCAFVLTENVAIPLLIGALVCLIQGGNTDTMVAFHQQRRWLILAGVLLGIAVGLRPAYISLCAIFLWYAGANVPPGRRLQTALPIGGALGLTLLAICGQNAAISGGHLIGLGGNGGVNFYMTQCKVCRVISVTDYLGGHWIFDVGSPQYADEPWRPILHTSRRLDDQAYFYTLGLRALARPQTWRDDLWESRKLFYGPMFPSVPSAGGFGALNPWCVRVLGTLLLASLIVPLLGTLRGLSLSREQRLLWLLVVMTAAMSLFFPAERRYGYSVLFAADLSLLGLLSIYLNSSHYLNPSCRVPFWHVRATPALRRRWRETARAARQITPAHDAVSVSPEEMP